MDSEQGFWRSLWLQSEELLSLGFLLNRKGFTLMHNWLLLISSQGAMTGRLKIGVFGRTNAKIG